MNGNECASSGGIRKCIQSDGAAPVFHDRAQQEAFPVSCSKERKFQPRASHMSHYHDRLASFEKWPRHVRAKPEEFADAGLFYTGCGDRVQCFSCSGKFHNWKDSDQPWKVHAKWFPNCRFVLQKKGSHYIQEIAKQHPNLNRLAPFSSKQTRRQEFSSPSSSSKDDTLRNNLCSHFDYNCVVNSSVVNSSVESDASSVGSSTANDFSVFANTKANFDKNFNIVVETKLKILKEEQTCKVCLDKITDCLFLPCRHICSCVECAQSLRFCPICREKLEKIIKIYRK